MIVLSVVLASAPMLCYAFHPISSKKDISGVYPTYPKINYGTGDKAKLIKRGEYLVRAGDCIACHTDTTTMKGGQAYAGGLPVDTPFGTFYSPNLTPDKKTGIGNWQFKDFKRAMHDGKNLKGQNYFPVFPYVFFSKVSDQDLRAMWAYLQNIPAINKANRKNDVPFPFNWRFALYGWKLLFYYPYRGKYQYQTDESAEWNRGRYLVDGLGHCSLCHTPLNLLGSPKHRYYLTGTFIGGFWAPNITGLGLQDTSVKEVTDVFSKSELIHQAGTVEGPMAEVTHNSLRYLTPADQQAIVVYLKTVKSKEYLGLKASYAPPTLQRGKKVYFSSCSTCHEEGLAGAPRIGDGENWYQRMKQQGLHVLYRNAINGYNSMPVKGACVTCSDEDIEAAVDYLVNESLSHSQKDDLKNPPPPHKPTEAQAKKIYQQSCSVCHAEGKFGAPITGDKNVWAPLIKKNMDTLIANTMQGSAKMPPKGGCKYCTTSEVIAAVKYMVKESKSEGDYSLW